MSNDKTPKVNRQTKPWTIELVAFLKSENGRDGWHPIPPELVPEKFRDPDVLAYMLAGNEASDVAGDQCWYRAVKLEQPAAANDEKRPQ
jgi:hypothetical protein